jgi:hypothetical protein
MKKHRWLQVCLALTLAGLMLWVVPGFAQGRGRDLRGPGSQCPMGWGQGQGPGQGQGQGQGPGAGSAYCPNSPGYQNCPGYGGNSAPGAMGSRGSRGGMGGRFNQPATQPTPPVTTQ